jgi:ribosomal protein S18 acetylase RimI-like enzyme
MREFIFVIEYTDSLNGITEKMLQGFFVGWPNPPSPSTHMKILTNSYRIWLAVDEDVNRVIGFINALSDGVLSAYIPLLEVLPAYQNRGIGKTLVNKMLNSLKDFYMIDLLCDNEMLGFYNKLGMHNATGAFIRNYVRQNCEHIN